MMHSETQTRWLLRGRVKLPTGGTVREEMRFRISRSGEIPEPTVNDRKVKVRM